MNNTPQWYWDLRNALKDLKLAQNDVRANRPVVAFENICSAMHRLEAAIPIASQQCPECHECFGEHLKGLGPDLPPCSRAERAMASQVQENQPDQ